MHTIRIWDLPLRLFHGALILCVFAMVATAQLGWMDWHFLCGYLILALLLFRFCWGFFGGHWSRFGSFVPRPSKVLDFLSGRSSPLDTVGHNPLGALSVLAMLSVLLLQVFSGFGSDDEISAAGPLVHHLNATTVSWLTTYHTKVGKWLLAALVVLHVGAIVRYRLHGTDLVTPMLNGDKALDFQAPSSDDSPRGRVRGLLLFFACALCVIGFIRVLG